jgi:hypothetical protein
MRAHPTRPSSVRHATGEIDFDFHRRDAAALRREAMQAFPVAKAAAAIACMLALLLAASPAHAQRGGGSYSQKGGVAMSGPPPQVRDHRGPRGKPGGGVQVTPACKGKRCHVHW